MTTALRDDYYGLSGYRCLFCNSDDIQTIAIKDNDCEFTDVVECQSCEQQFYKGDLMEVQRPVIENPKMDERVISWFEVSLLLENGKKSREIYRANDHEDLYEFVEYLCKKGMWESEIKAELFEKHGKNIYYIGDCCLEIKEGKVV